MHFGIVTIFPQMFNALETGITGRALTCGLISVRCWNPRDFTSDRYRRVDDRPYGGGPGMVMLAEPLRAAIRAARSALGQAQVIYLSPQGTQLRQAGVVELAKRQSLIWLCGRYEGVDERLLQQEIDEEFSIGDYVISGGELAAMVGIDAITRMLPGGLGAAASAEEDSFSAGLLDCPHYTRPEYVDGVRVPEVLMSGDHGAIQRWRTKQSVGRTWLRRPDLLQQANLDLSTRALLEEFIAESEQELD